MGVGAGVAVVAGRRVVHRHADAHPTLAGVPGGAGVAVVARGAIRLRGAGADAALAGVVARAGVLVVARGAVEQRSVADAGAVLAGVGGGAGVAIVAARAGERRHRAARCPVAGPRVALVRGAGDRRADELAAAGAGVVDGAGVAVVAARAGERRHRAARRAVAGPRVALVRGAGDRRADALSAAVAGVVEGAGVAVVAARAGERRHRAARRAVAGPRVALVRGAGDGGADALPAAVAGVVERAGVAVVARRARGGGDGGARRAVAAAAGARIRGAGGGGVLVVAVGGGGAERAAGGGGAGTLPAPVADVVEGAGVAVVARCVGRLEGVRRAVHARPRAGLGYVACVGRGVADRTRVGGRVNAPAAPVALIRAAHVAVVLARGAARGRRARARSGLTAVPGGAPGAVVARGPVGHGRARAGAGLAGVGAGAGVLIVAGRPVGDCGAAAHPTLAGIAAGAGVAVVAGRPGG